MSTINSYVSAICQPVIEGKQEANAIFVSEDELPAILPIIEQSNLHSQIHMQGEGAAVIYVYRSSNIEKDLIGLSRLSTDQSDYYYRTGSLLGYDQTVVQECIDRHPEFFKNVLE